MRLPSLVREVALLGLAVAVGWWWRGADSAVLAQRSGSSRSGSDANLAFQLVGAGPNAALAVYNPDNKNLYVYNAIGQGSSSVPCSYSFSIVNPGAAMERKNCPVGELR